MIFTGNVLDHILDFTTLARYRLKVIDMGGLNMFGTYQFVIPHGLTFADIRSVTGYVVDDALSIAFPISGAYYDALGAGAFVGPGIYWDVLQVVLMHQAGGVFDAAGYSSLANSRGKLFVFYED